MEPSPAPNISPCPIFAPLPYLTELCASLGVPHLPSLSMHPQLQGSVFPQRLHTLGVFPLLSSAAMAGLVRSYQARDHPGDWQGKGVVQPEHAHRHLCCCCCFGEPGQQS